VLIPALGGVALLLHGAGGAAASPLLIGAAILAWVFYLYREQLALVGRLLAISSNALWANAGGIVGGSLLLQAAGLLVAAPLAACVVLGFANGGVVRSPAVASIQPGGGGGESESGPPVCLDAQGQEVLCCGWAPDGWAVWYMAWAALMLGWTTLLAFTAKVFVVSGVTAQW
jgi:hypothetical protein